MGRAEERLVNALVNAAHDAIQEDPQNPYFQPHIRDAIASAGVLIVEREGLRERIAMLVMYFHGGTVVTSPLPKDYELADQILAALSGPAADPSEQGGES